MKNTLLVFLLAALAVQAISAAEERLPRSQLSRSQDAIETRLNDAQRLLFEGSAAVGRNNYHFANELLGQASVRLSRSETDLDRQINQIASSTWVLGAPNVQVLRARRDDLFGRYLEVNRAAQALARDLLPFTGLDMDHVRSLLTYLRNLADNHPDAETRRMAATLLSRLETAVEAGDSTTIKGIIEEIVDKAPTDNPPPPAQTQISTPGLPPDQRPDIGFGRDPISTPIPGGGGQTPPLDKTKPALFTPEFLDALQVNLQLLCREATNPAIREWACRKLQQLPDMIRDGDWTGIASIFSEIQEKSMQEPTVLPKMRPWPVVGSDGTVQFFPPNLNQPGIGRSYIGGEGANLVREEQVFVSFAGSGADLRPETRAGERRDWRFQVNIVSDNPTANGRAVTFELNETRRAGTFSRERWQVMLNGAVVASGEGRQFTHEFAQNGDFQVQFEGQTEWGSPFRVGITAPVVIAR